VNVSLKIDPALIKTISDLKRRVIAEAMVVEADEIAAGRTVIDVPVATMKTWFKIASPFDEESDDEELIFLWKNGDCVCHGVKRNFGAHRVRFLTGETTYREARRLWGAFAPIRKLLLDNGVTAEEFLELGPSIFPWIYGVLTLLRRRNDDGATHVLVGLRNARIDGHCVEIVAFPGGLVRPDEGIEEAAARHVREDCGIEIDRVKTGFAINDRATSCRTLFVCVSEIRNEQDVSGSFEWKSGKMLWIPENALLSAIGGDETAMNEAFQRAGVNLKKGVAVTPFAAEPARLLLTRAFPA
jgi:ADP-ribose pyrophosphatase YjhB (NUDIX family)